MSKDSSELSSLGKETPKNQSWGPLGSILIVVLSYLSAQLLGVILLSIYPAIRGWNSTKANNWLNNSTLAQFLFVVISEIVVITILWLFIRHRTTFKKLGLKKPKAIDIVYTIVGIIAYFMLYIFAIIFVGIFVKINTGQQQDLGFNNVIGVGSLVMTFISLVILPPIVEEITFRGFLYTGLKKSFNPIVATLITSLLFALPHILENDAGQGLLWVAGLDTFVLSIVLCYLREKTGRLSAGMGVHAIKNAVAFISLFIVHVH